MACWRPKAQFVSSTRNGNSEHNPVTRSPAGNPSPSSVSPSASASPPSSSVQPSELPVDPPTPPPMTNFVCNPQAFLPDGAHIEHGWQRPACSRVALGGEPPRRHEEYAIVTLHPEPLEHLVLDTLLAVVQHFQHAFLVRVVSSFRSPLGLGLLRFQSATQRQSMLDRSPWPFANNSEIRVVKHDEARNCRTCPYIRTCRILFLGFPLDYQTMEFFKAVVSPFGRLLSWHESPNK